MSCFRYARTKNEQTQYYATTTNELSIPIKVRVRRQPLALFSAWDDYVKGDHGINNWKQYRKNQWKT